MTNQQQIDSVLDAYVASLNPTEREIATALAHVPIRQRDVRTKIPLDEAHDAKVIAVLGQLHEKYGNGNFFPRGHDDAVTKVIDSMMDRCCFKTGLFFDDVQPGLQSRLPKIDYIGLMLVEA